MVLASIYIIILYLLFIVAFYIFIHWVYFTSAIPFEFEVNEDLNGGGGGGGPLVGCRLKFGYFVGRRLKFSIFVGSRLNFLTFVGCRKISVNN